MNRGSWILFATIFAVLLLGAADPAPEKVAEAAKTEPPIHVDGEALTVALGDAAKCLAREDSACARAALDRLEANCRPIQVEPDSRYDDRVRNLDRAFHATVDRARELAGVDDLPNVSRQYTWVRQTCVMCHTASRMLGIGPELPVPEPVRSTGP
ncbi:MAG: hypothetical protein OEV00_02890 [Acidobacteriota bacterium]|nr:hypothetical protein [Acidobacteriota bacterium]MDH3784256.1 hypothetical protein [Acidobacteriota bacterium]